MRKKALRSSATGVLLLGATFACESGREPVSGSGGESGPFLKTEVASVTFAQVVDFSGNSLMICGSREPAADGKYPCLSELPCTCFNFTAGGSLVEGPVEGLCPSENVPTGDWTFTYTVYTGANCTGDVLNAEGNPNNFVCYDVDDLVAQLDPNMSVEPLVAGQNFNQILCTSAGTNKRWGVHGCVITEPGLYDCDCELVDDVCACGNVTAEDLPEGCSFVASCRIDCRPLPAAFNCAEQYVVAGEPLATLYRLDTSTDPGTLVPIGTFTETLNAIGVSPMNGQIYGLTANRTPGVTQHLVRVGSNGTFTDLGAVPGLTWRSTVGAFLQDGTLLVYSQPPPDGIGRYTKIDVNTGTIISTFDPPSPVPDFADLAVDPLTGAIWGYDASSNALGTLDPNTLAFTPVCTNFPGGNTEYETGGSSFDQSGTLFLYGSRLVGTGSEQLAQVNFSDCSATALVDAPTVTASDGASCSTISP